MVYYFSVYNKIINYYYKEYFRDYIFSGWLMVNYGFFGDM